MICCCIRCWRVCTSLTISPSSWALSSSLRFFRAYSGRRYGEGPPVARPLRLESWGWSGQPQLIPKPLICGVLHVADSDLPPWPGTLHLGEVHAKFLGLTLGGLRGVGLFLPAALSGILGLPGCLTGGVLGALRGLTSLVCHLARCVLSLLGGPSGDVLSLLGSALGCILRSLRSLSRLVGNLPSGILGLPGRLTGGVLDALRGLAGLICHLAHGVLVFPPLLRTGVGLVARVFDGLSGLRGGRELQVQHATVWPELQLQERPGLVGHGGRLVALFVGSHLVAFGRRQIGGVADRALVYYVALLVEDHLDQVPFLVNGALDGVALLVGGGV